MIQRYITTITAILCLSALAVQAQVVVAFDGASGPGLASMSFNNHGTPLLGNDDVAGASPNWISVNQKDYSSVDYIDMSFVVGDIGIATCEYILTEGVNNGTGIEWTDYHIELGYGTGAGFVLSPPGDGLDFDAPDLNSPYDFGPFVSLTIGEDTIDAVGGTMPAGAFEVFAFPIDVPSGIGHFTIRQYPTIAVVENEEKSWGELKDTY